ncbi:basic proline-rich protein-like [Meles meles]|uniref:basic proline-rich protein-like n=1 Tax=Meles meles TaxID=9662 RepID=UPI001E69FB4B|nr:basic proline-rich protein-like [Meles meles]
MRPPTPRAASGRGHFRRRRHPLLKGRARPEPRRLPSPPAGRQPPPTCPLTEEPPPPPHVAARRPVLNGPGPLAPAGRSGPRPSPRRGRPAASPAWRPRGSPSPALRRSNVTQPAPTVTPRANWGARPRLSAPRAARGPNPTTSPTGQDLRLRKEEPCTPRPLKGTPRPQSACVLGILTAPSTSDVVCTPGVEKTTPLYRGLGEDACVLPSPKPSSESTLGKPKAARSVPLPSPESRRRTVKREAACPSPAFLTDRTVASGRAAGVERAREQVPGTARKPAPAPPGAAGRGRAGTGIGRGCSADPGTGDAHVGPAAPARTRPARAQRPAKNTRRPGREGPRRAQVEEPARRPRGRRQRKQADGAAEARGTPNRRGACGCPGAARGDRLPRARSHSRGRGEGRTETERRSLLCGFSLDSKTERNWERKVVAPRRGRAPALGVRGVPRGRAECGHPPSRGPRGAVPPPARAEAAGAGPGPPPGSSGATPEQRPPPRPARRGQVAVGARPARLISRGRWRGAEGEGKGADGQSAELAAVM